MTSSTITYFGYGSLVNRDTRPADEQASTARLKGWQRVWQHRVDGSDRERLCTSLSIEPQAVTQTGGIDGVIVRIPESQLAQLDEREAGYERLILPADNFELPESFDGEQIMVYRSLPQNRLMADAEYPILQSYIDCVMAGYLQRFGDAGLQAFMDSTRGWEHPVLNDRKNPIYPRWVAIDGSQRAVFDACLARVR